MSIAKSYDAEAVAAARAQAAYEAAHPNVDTRKPWNHLGPKQVSEWAAIAAAVVMVPGELAAVHEVVMWVANDWPDRQGDPFTLRQVKWMARELNRLHNSSELRG